MAGPRRRVGKVAIHSEVAERLRALGLLDGDQPAEVEPVDDGPAFHVIFYKTGAWCVDELDARTLDWMGRNWPRPFEAVRLDDPEDEQQARVMAFEAMIAAGVDPA